MHECQFHEKCFIEEKIVFLLNNFHLFNCILEAYIRCWYSISTTFINSQLAVWKFIFTLHNIFVSAFCQVSLFFEEEKMPITDVIITCFHIHKKKSLKSETHIQNVSISSWKFIFGTSFAANHNLYMLAKRFYEKLAKRKIRLF